MAHKLFAILDEVNLVTDVQVGSDDGISTEQAMATHLGVDVSKVKEFSEDGTLLSRGVAAIGDEYRPTQNDFIGIQPFPSWNWHEADKKWKAPVTSPSAYDETYNFWWEEDTQKWRGYPNNGAPSYDPAEDPRVDYYWNPETSQWEAV